MTKVEFHGYEKVKVKKLRDLIVICMKTLGLGDDAIWEIFPTTTGICDGSDKPSPYLSISGVETSKFYEIIEELKRMGVCEDIWLPTEQLFFNKIDILSGEWEVKYKNHFGIPY